MDGNCFRRVLVGTMIVLFVVISSVTRTNYGLLRKSENLINRKYCPPGLIITPVHHLLPDHIILEVFWNAVWRHKCLRKEIFEEKMGCCVECLLLKNAKNLTFGSLVGNFIGSHLIYIWVNFSIGASLFVSLSLHLCVCRKRGLKGMGVQIYEF